MGEPRGLPSVGLFACAQLLIVSNSATPWTAVRQAPLSMGFYQQEYCNGLPSPSPEDLPDPGIEPMSPVAPALACEFFATEPPGKIDCQGSNPK